MAQTVSNSAKFALPEGAQSLFRCLAVDDGLREALTQDPAGILARFDIDIAPEDVPGEVRLPSRAVLANAFGSDEFDRQPPYWAPFLG